MKILSTSGKSILFFTQFGILFLSLCLAWSEGDLLSATFLANKGIIKLQTDKNNYRLDDTITRAEVVGVALKMNQTSLPANYKCQRYFSDVTSNDWVCQVVEMAADKNIISRKNLKFRPQDKITKSEALSIILNSLGQKGLSTQELNTLSAQQNILFDTEAIDWQKGIIARAKELEIINSYINFWPNRSAIRAEVFQYAKKILENNALCTISGEVSMKQLCSRLKEAPRVTTSSSSNGTKTNNNIPTSSLDNSESEKLDVHFSVNLTDNNSGDLDGVQGNDIQVLRAGQKSEFKVTIFNTGKNDLMLYVYTKKRFISGGCEGNLKSKNNWRDIVYTGAGNHLDDILQSGETISYTCSEDVTSGEGYKLDITVSGSAINASVPDVFNSFESTTVAFSLPPTNQTPDNNDFCEVMLNGFTYRLNTCLIESTFRKKEISMVDEIEFIITTNQVDQLSSTFFVIGDIEGLPSVYAGVEIPRSNQVIGKIRVLTNLLPTGDYEGYIPINVRSDAPYSPQRFSNELRLKIKLHITE